MDNLIQIMCGWDNIQRHSKASLSLFLAHKLIEVAYWSPTTTGVDADLKKLGEMVSAFRAIHFNKANIEDQSHLTAMRSIDFCLPLCSYFFVGHYPKSVLSIVCAACTDRATFTVFVCFHVHRWLHTEFFDAAVVAVFDVLSLSPPPPSPLWETFIFHLHIYIWDYLLNSILCVCVSYAHMPVPNIQHATYRYVWWVCAYWQWLSVN